MTPAQQTSSEKSKYTRMWDRPEYRRYSPGGEAVPDALKFMSKGQTVYDLGCGTGVAGSLMAGEGMNVTLVDFAPNAVKYPLPFIEACLWEMDLPRADWIFCADVLEHIPTDRVDDVLRKIADTCINAYLQIHCRPDGCGALIGETLHMTVKSPEWWLAKVLEFMPAKRLNKSKDHVVILAGLAGILVGQAERKNDGK